MRAPRPVDFIQSRPAAWPGLAALAVAALLAAWQAYDARTEVVALDAERAGVAALARRNDSARSAMSADDIRRHGQINVLALRLATPWEELLSVFERRSRSAVRLVRLEQELDTGLLRFVGTTASPRAMMDYVISLEAEPVLTDVKLRGHETRRNEPGTPVQFEVQARWRSGAAATSGSATTAEAALR